MPAYPASSFRALVEGRCPRCHQGPLFNAPVTNLTRFAEMPTECPACGQTYEPEPGFYYGAMYISYGFSVLVVIMEGLLLYLLGDPPAWVYVTAVSLTIVLSTPLFFRYARAMMLYWFGSTAYDPARDPARR